MAKLRNYKSMIAAPGGRSFYSAPRKRTRRARAPTTAALKNALAGRRKARRVDYSTALKAARDVVHQQAVFLHETFGGHSIDYYCQEIMQRGHLERSRRKASRWNVFLRHELKKRNAGMPPVIVPHILAL